MLDADRSGYVDIHSHILPNLDDGPATLEGSLDLAKEAVANGISDIIATPHLNRDLFPFSTNASRQACKQLQEALAAADIPLKLHLGAEVKIHPKIVEELNAGKVPMLAESRYLLLELPFDMIPPYAHEIVFQMRLAGVTPILAHPERNASIQRDPRKLGALIDLGCLTQINSTSLTGRLGEASQSTAVSMLTQGWAHMIGSDSHFAGDRGPNFKEAITVAAKYVGFDEAQKLVRENPKRLLEN